MSEPQVPAPARIAGVALALERRRTLAELGLPQRRKPEAKRGGTSAAQTELAGFLTERGVGYRRDMSSPVSGWNGCSRLSPYLAFGAISMREVYQRTRERESVLKCARPTASASIRAGPAR